MMPGLVRQEEYGGSSFVFNDIWRAGSGGRIGARSNKRVRAGLLF